MICIPVLERQDDRWWYHCNYHTTTGSMISFSLKYVNTYLLFVACSGLGVSTSSRNLFNVLPSGPVPDVTALSFSPAWIGKERRIITGKQETEAKKWSETQKYVKVMSQQVYTNGSKIWKLLDAVNRILSQLEILSSNQSHNGFDDS